MTTQNLRLDLRVYEDLEQAAIVSSTTVHADPRTYRILTGPWRGTQLRDVEDMQRLDRPDLTATRTVTRPWWRLWQPTITVTFTPREMHSGELHRLFLFDQPDSDGVFEQAFDDGGAHD